jgi:hypothetical protein
MVEGFDQRRGADLQRDDPTAAGGVLYVGACKAEIRFRGSPRA